MGTIGIIGAMEVEVKELKEQMQITRQLTKAGMEFCEGILEGQDVVVVRSGVGKVNAAVCTQILIDVFDVKAVINTGIAGSLKAEINIGDLVISSDLVHHDMDAVSFGYPKGQIPQMDVFSFEADKALADLAEKVCEEVNPEIQVFHGRVVSGDQFIADKETKENISTLFAGYCTEMEGAAIAQTAHLNEVPFVVLRAISDKADDSASMDYPTFEKQAVAHSVRLVRGMMKNLAAKYSCNAIAIQCWNALQDELGIMPCAANAILNEMGIPIVCETDIHGAITALMVEAADLGRHRGMFADWTVRHPDNENGELLQHCGPWPCSCAAVKPKLTYPLAFDHPGALTAEAKHGDLTLARFDGDNGEYSLLLGNARGIDGPAGMGTYLWVEVDNLKRLEAKIVEGPYIHHCVAIHANVVPVLYEACKYIGIVPDLYDPIEEDVKAYLRGE